MLGERIARAVGDQVLGQDDRQVLLGHRDDAARIAMDDRDRRSPVALPADAPVAQAPGRLLAAEAAVLERGGDRVDGDLVGQAAVDVGIDRHAARRVGVPVLPLVVRELLAVDVDDLQQVDAVLLGEGEVALVVGRHAHHRAVAVVHQDVVADPERDLLVAERVLDDEAGVDAALGQRRDLGLGRAAGLARLEEGRDRRVLLGRAQRERMLRRDRAERDAHDRVGARREHPQAAAADERAGAVANGVQEGEANALALAEPVLLHQLDALGPARQAGAHALEQLVGVLRDLRGSSPGSRASRPARRSASRALRSPARWRARSGRPGPS